MKFTLNRLLGIALVVFASMSWVVDAEARRLGGGRTLGRQSNVTQRQATPPAAAPGVAAPWTVQVGATALRLPRAPWEEPWGPWGPYGHFGSPFAVPGRDYVVTGTGQVIFFPVFPRFETPYYQRTVSLVIRDAGSGRVAYETRAAHDGRWNSSPALWSAMLDAALQGFPQPPTGTRQVNIEVPR